MATVCPHGREYHGWDRLVFDCPDCIMSDRAQVVLLIEENCRLRGKLVRRVLDKVEFDRIASRFDIVEADINTLKRDIHNAENGIYIPHVP